MGPIDVDHEIRVRTAAFDWLRRYAEEHGDVLGRRALEHGFDFGSDRVALVGPKGIFKPRIVALPLSITTVYEGPYADKTDDAGYLSYRYRGTDPDHADNVGLRETMVRRLPLCYFHGVAHNRYLAIWPVFVQADDPAALTFTVAVEDAMAVVPTLRGEVSEQDEGRRRYLTAITRQRLHQRGFRERVLDAYREQCAVCRLRHRELLESAHIIPDGEPAGDPVVPNGLALCALHHAAFDKFFLAVRPDYTVEVRDDILREHDGPMLVHGLQQLHDRRILLPRDERLLPDRNRLAVRYRRFREAA